MAAMTRKHFIALADALRNTRPSSHNPESKRTKQWEQDLEAIASVCKSVNPAFKPGRWKGYVLGECGPFGGQVKN